MPRLLSVTLVALMALVLYGGLSELLRPEPVRLPQEDQLAASGLLYRVAAADQPRPSVVRVDRILFDRDAVTVVYQSRQALSKLEILPAGEERPRPQHPPIQQLYVGDGWHVTTVPYEAPNDVSQVELVFAFSQGASVHYRLNYPTRALQDNTANFRFVVPRYQVERVFVGVHWIEIETAQPFAPSGLTVAGETCGLEESEEAESVIPTSEGYSYRFPAPPVPRLVIDVDVDAERDDNGQPTSRKVTLYCSS